MRKKGGQASRKDGVMRWERKSDGKTDSDKDRETEEKRLRENEGEKMSEGCSLASKRCSKLNVALKAHRLC